MATASLSRAPSAGRKNLVKRSHENSRPPLLTFVAERSDADLA